MRVAAPTVVALCSLAALACGGSGGGSVAISDLAAQELSALCDHGVRCGGVTSAAACAATARAGVASEAGLLAAMVANGSTKYDPDKAGACLD